MMHVLEKLSYFFRLGSLRDTGWPALETPRESWAKPNAFSDSWLFSCICFSGFHSSFSLYTGLVWRQPEALWWCPMLAGPRSLLGRNLPSGLAVSRATPGRRSAWPLSSGEKGDCCPSCGIRSPCKCQSLGTPMKLNNSLRRICFPFKFQKCSSNLYYLATWKKRSKRELSS